MPPANNIGFSATSDMVTSTIGVQTSCPTSPTHQNFYGNDYDDEDDICPKHFTDIHKCKLEDTFSRKQKPDDIQLQIIAMECNLLYKDVRDWFRKRRLKWMEELVRSENSLRTSSTSSSDSRRSSSNNHNREYNKQSFSTTNSTNVVPTSDSNNNSMVVANSNKQKQQNNLNNKHQQQQTSIDSNTYKNKNLLKNSSTGGGRNHHDISTT